MPYEVNMKRILCTPLNGFRGIIYINNPFGKPALTLSLNVLFFFRFCVGDRFYLCENKILCEYDYEERLVFANMAFHPPPMSHLKRQTSIPPVSNFEAMEATFLT